MRSLKIGQRESLREPRPPVGHGVDQGRPADKWLAEVTKDGSVTVEVYVRDAVWPSVAYSA